MKRLSYILAALLVACGCTKENNESPAPGKELMTFTVSAAIDDSQDVRANLDETSLEVLWQEGDRIGLVDAEGNITPALLDAEDAGSSQGRFTYQAEKAVDIVYAYYPYTGNESCSKGKLSLNMNNALVMAGKYQDGGLLFKNACSIVQLNLSGEENYVRKISLRCPAANLSGAGVLDLTHDTPVFQPDEAGDAVHGVEVDLGSSRLHMGAQQKAVAYIVLPSGTYAGLTVETLGNTDKTGTDKASEVSLIYSSTKSVTLNPGRIRPLNVTMSYPEGVTVYGRVLCGEKPVGGVAVTDGENVVTTDADGYYSMSSAKPHGMVYISVPSGYTVKRGYGAVPEFYHHTAKNAGVAERIDFELIDDGDQTNHTMLLLGDIHLMGYNSNGNEANRNLTQFNALVNEINRYVADNEGSKIYAMTLGDMTWDSYWIWNNFGIPDYVQISDRFNLNVYCTVGNHDNDLTVAEDWACMADWRRYYGPTYYSFNIGQVHYISLDNVITRNGGTIETRDYNCGLTDQILTWLKKDLALVAKDTPIVVAMHIPLLNINGGTYMSGDNDMDTYKIIDAFYDYSDVTYFSAHSHTLYNNYGEEVLNWNKFKYQPINEHNVGAACADFWGSGSIDKDLLISRDGSPGGYRILNVAGKNRQMTFKATGKDKNYFFRAYDRNSIQISAEKYIPNAGANHKAEFEKYLDEYADASSENYVYIHVWDWYEGWNISVKEGSTSLAVEDLGKYKDPLYMISTMVRRCNAADNGSYTLDMYPQNCQHMFRVKASSATSTVTITVTDPFGNMDIQEIKRPRAFSIAEYAADGDIRTKYVTPSFELDSEMNL